MPFFRIHAKASGSTYLGVVEAESAEEAAQKVAEVREGETISLCWQCASKIDEVSIWDFEASECGDDEVQGEPNALEDES